MKPIAIASLWIVAFAFVFMMLSLIDKHLGTETYTATTTIDVATTTATTTIDVATTTVPDAASTTAICTDNCPLVEADWLTLVEIEQLIIQTFPEDPDTAIAIAHCESSLNPEAVNTNNPNGSHDSGLMQINSVHKPRLAELGLNPHNVHDNLTFARILYDERGWQPWVCYTAGLIYAK